MGKSLNDKSSERLQAVLRGGFAGPPTQLKDVPRKDGVSRSKRRPSKPGLRRSSPRKKQEKRG
jgi:hypothetical protein